MKYKLRWISFMHECEQDFTRLEDALECLCGFYNSEDENGINGGIPRDLTFNEKRVDRDVLIDYLDGSTTMADIRELLK